MKNIINIITFLLLFSGFLWADEDSAYYWRLNEKVELIKDSSAFLYYGKTPLRGGYQLYRHTDETGVYQIMEVRSNTNFPPAYSCGYNDGTRLLYPTCKLSYKLISGYTLADIESAFQHVTAVSDSTLQVESPLYAIACANAVMETGMMEYCFPQFLTTEGMDEIDLSVNEVRIYPTAEGRARIEDYINTGREMQAETKQIDCADEGYASFIDEMIQNYHDAPNDNRRDIYLAILGKMHCEKTISLFKNIIATNSSEFLRCQAIMYLGWVDDQSSIPFLLQRAKMLGISDSEKAEIGSCLTVLHDYKDAEPILNAVCFTTNDTICSKCYWAYNKIANESSVRYYRYILKNREGSYYNPIQMLTELGDLETVYPLLEKELDDEKDYNRRFAIRCLEIIGDEKSMNLIRSKQQDYSEIVRQEVQRVLNKNLEINGEE